ncbi:hypothetical protein PUN4_450134 [Paraburkholderia unamae]|nr:hypothetical protein PUN4_450134 [Paraburkholderia unamae]
MTTDSNSAHAHSPNTSASTLRRPPHNFIHAIFNPDHREAAYHTSFRFAAKHQTGLYIAATQPVEIWWPAGEGLIKPL